MNRSIGLTALLLSLWLGCVAQAAVARFHYVPADASGKMIVPATSAYGGAGERLSWFGSVRQACPQPPRATRMVTFRHPCTGRAVIVPLALPDGTPVIEHRGPMTVVYNYGSYTVEVDFLRDGSVDVVYNSGFLRGL